MTFTIPGRLPGTNEITNKERAHWSKGYAFRRDWTRQVGQWIVACMVPKYMVPVAITITFFEPDFRRDCDNIHGGQKFILDALKKTGRIQNDSRKWVRSCVPIVADPDKNNPRIEVRIEPIAAVNTTEQDGLPPAQQTAKRLLANRRTAVRWSRRRNERCENPDRRVA